MSNANALELLMLSLVNDERAAAGLEPLRLITVLNAAAEDHSSWMLETNQFSHEGEGGSSPGDRMTEAGYPFEGGSMSSENIGWQSARGAEGFEDDVAQIHEGLMQSPGHRANILDPNAEDIGIGIEIGTFSSAGGDFQAVMATQVFAKTDADVSAYIDPQTGGEETPTPPETPDTPETPPVAEMPDLEAPENDDDTPVTDDPETPDMEEETPEDETPDVPEDDEDDPVAEAPDPETPDEDEDDPVAEAPDPEMSEDEDIAMDDCPIDEEPMPEDDANSDDDMGVCDVPGDVALPFDLANFTVDLSDAFEFRQEGDQLIWETSEDKIMAAFQQAFDEWTARFEMPTADDMADLMLDESDMDLAPIMDDETEDDDWIMADCA